LVLLISSGCASTQGLVKEEQNKVMEAYLKAVSSGRIEAAEYVKENLRLKDAFGYVKPYVPVVAPADVRLIWLPTHKSTYEPDALVGGHWVYVIVRPSRWFIDSQAQSKGKIPLIIPYKESNKK